MKQAINLSIALVLLLGFLAPRTATAEGTPLWEQLPGGDHGVYSLVGNWIVADDFDFTVATTIGQVEFWSPTSGPVEVNVVFYTNTTNGSGYNIPDGTPLYTDSSTTTGTLEDTSVCSQTYCPYRHSIILDTPLALDPGHYWISIYGTSELLLSYDANLTANSMAHWYAGTWYSDTRNLAFRLLAPEPVCPETVEVTNANNSGAGSLRQALLDVCADGTITFNPSLSGATIFLSTGQLVVGRNVTIDGSALPARVGINSEPDYTSRGFFINSGVTATINSLRVTHGYSDGDGGGIYNQGNLTVINGYFFNNLAEVFGGGIYNAGTLTLINSSLVSNSSNGYGGGIFNNGNILSLNYTSFVENAAMYGGGISNSSTGTVSITNSSFTENFAMNGGGISNTGGSLSVATTIFDDNHAGITGGGLFNEISGTMTVTNSTLTLNYASAGGGIHNESGTVTVTGSTLSQNYTNDPNGSAGGILNGPGATMTVANSTLVENIADYYGGGIYNRGTLTLTNSTLSGNSAMATRGGGLVNYAGTLHMANTIIANSISGGDCINDGGATIPTNTHNLVEDGSCSPYLSGDPLLGALVDNGGPTHTIALLAGSPAIDTGDDSTCAAAPVSGMDQRGITRPQGAHCDIGAYEKEVFIIFMPLIVR